MVVEVDTVVEQADTVLERAACMVAELAMVVAHAESPLERSVQLAGLAAVAGDPDQVRCRTLGLATEGSYRRRHTSMLGLVVILTRFDQEGISLASSQVAAF